MNNRVVFNILGKILVALSLLMLLPMIVSLIYAEKAYSSFAISAAASFTVGLVLVFASKPKSHIIYAREGFVITAFAWIFTSVAGAFPFYLSGEIPSFVDAFFETVSGFTTTGASILNDVTSLSKGLLFWRSFSHWIGGMGVLVLVVALIPNVSERSIHILRAEMSGPVVGKLVPKLKDTAKILYLIYILLTVILGVLLKLGGMSLYDSIVHAFATTGTGGFGIYSDSVLTLSPYIQWVLTAFMIISSINFNLYYLILVGKGRLALKSTELWVYLTLIAAASTVIFFDIRHLCASFEETLRTSVFQVSSIISTTGFASADFNEWNTSAKTILFLLMISGGCAGSTAGGLKVSRLILLAKQISREFKKLLRPRSVSSVVLDGKQTEEKTLNSVSIYFSFYMFFILATLLLLSFDDMSMEANVAVAFSAFNNVGPGFAEIGPMSSYAAYSDFSKLVISFAMLLGRLEIFPLLLAFSPSVWAKKSKNN